MKFLRSPIYFLAILTLIAVAATGLYIHSKNTNCNPENITEIVNSVTQHRWEKLIKVTNELVNQLETSGKPDLISYNPDKLTGTDMSLFILSDGKVIFWSDNRIPIEEILDKSLDPKRIIRLKNGWYQRYHINHEQYTILGFSLIKQNYPYDNEYLKNAFQADYRLETVPAILVIPGEYNIYDQDERFLFAIDFGQEYMHGSHSGKLLFPLFLISFVLLLLLVLHLHLKLNPFPSWPNASIIAFIFDALIIRFLLFFFRFPDAVHQTYIFNPHLYASSELNGSLGDLLLNSVTILLIAYAFFRYWKVKSSPKLYKQQSIAINALLLFAAPAMIYVFVCAVRSLIIDSTLSFNFRNMLGVDLYSYIGLLVIVILALALMLLMHHLFIAVKARSDKPKDFIIAILPALALTSLCAVVRNETIISITLMIFVVYSAIYLTTLFRTIPGINHAILVIALVSLGITQIINTYNKEKEQRTRLLVASNYAQKDDPMAEYLFKQAREEIYSDTAVAEMVFQENPDEDLIITYILQNYFSGGENYWARFNFQITICNEFQKLVIENTNEVIDCFEFFNMQIKESGFITITDDFALIYDRFGNANYLGILYFENMVLPDPYIVKVFIEIFPKIVPVDVGYLELLVDQEIKDELDINRYSNGRYFKGQLVASYGKYVYSIDLTNYDVDTADHYFFSKGGFSHLYFKTGEDSVILVSMPEDTVLDMVAPFSLFLLVFIMLLAMTYLVRQGADPRKPFRTNFKNRLQLTLLTIIVASFIVIGFTSVYYISILNRNKNMDNLKEKARSIRIEVEHKLADKEILDHNLKPYIQSILKKFNDVFATDINLFDVDGKLLGSSRQNIFDEGLISGMMNPYAYREMALHQKTLFVHEENIGELEYLSAYIPFKNNQGRIIAYINLPYFARQTELSDEISSFMMAFINIYLLLIAITIIIAFVISDMIAKPLILIRDKIQRVKLGAANEHIEWYGYDEIADLVNEYNRMIDELEKSAGLLAKSERESAWREMAKQVAHEIKNPLTPMKLNLQYLEKTLSEGKENWKQQFEKFASVMHQQIESLATIASAFSDFANMPKGNMQNIVLEDAIRSAITLFEGYPDIGWETEFNTGINKHAYVYGDPEQINRLIINLVSNAVQAKVKEKPLRIKIELNENEGFWEIRIHDNGRGIDDELQEKIFLPNFTTKTSGMGLGLAIARSIVESMGGDISFTSDKAYGTTFTVIIPKSNQ